jgi:hypothetical protein
VRLTAIVKRLGPDAWSRVAMEMPGRTGRQCRERWTNYVNPAIGNDPWTEEEQLLLLANVEEYGRHWHFLAEFFPTRSANQIKNHWFRHERHIPLEPQAGIPPLSSGPPAIAIPEGSSSDEEGPPVVDSVDSVADTGSDPPSCPSTPRSLWNAVFCAANHHELNCDTLFDHTSRGDPKWAPL